MLEFVDETGLNDPHSGYSLIGTPAIATKMLVRGKRHSAMAICIDGVLDVHITTETVDEDEFCKFIELSLIPQLPFDGSNPRSVVVLDNASIHHTGQACVP